MSNALLHAINKTRTFLDVESGSYITCPKSPHPPVNDKINNLIIYGSTTGGEGTPSAPVALNSTPSSFYLSVTGRNLFDSDVIPAGPVTINGVSISYDSATKTITLNGTATADTDRDYSLTTPIDVISTTGYKRKFWYVSGSFTSTGIDYLMIRMIGSGSTRMELSAHTSNYTTSPVVTTDTEPATTTYFRIIYYTGQTFNNLKFKVSMEYSPTVMTAFEPYKAVVRYPYRLEDTNGVLHTLNNLPDGTRDEYNRDGGQLTQRVKVLTVTSGTGWKYYSLSDTLALVYYDDMDNVWGSVSVSANLRCTIAKAGTQNEAGYVALTKYTNRSQISFKVLKSELPSLDNDGAVAWINARIAAHGSIVIMYPLSAPQVYGIKAYSPGVFEYNQKPSSIPYYTSVFTDALPQPVLRCEVRKLGNRAMAYYDLATVSGELLETVSGEQIQVKI